MCEYLRPVVALEWLKACCTDMITWMSSFSYEETMHEHDDSKELPVMAMWKMDGTVRHYTSHWRSLMH